MNFRSHIQRVLSVVLAIVICLTSLASGFAASAVHFSPKNGPFYHNPNTGRFWTEDTYEGVASDPASLHKYTYCGNSPANCYDPSGHETLAEIGTATAIGAGVGTILGAINSGVQGYMQGLRGWDLASEAAQGAGTGATSGAVGGALGGGYVAAKSFFAAYSSVSFLLTASYTSFIGYGIYTDIDDVVEALGEGNNALAYFRASFAITTAFLPRFRIAGEIKPASLSTYESRLWYYLELKRIPTKIDLSLSLKEKAIQAFNLRNNAKMMSGNFMADRNRAAQLDIDEPIPTLEQIVDHAHDIGYAGDEVYDYILKAATRSRTSVNLRNGIIF